MGAGGGAAAQQVHPRAVDGAGGNAAPGWRGAGGHLPPPHHRRRHEGAAFLSWHFRFYPLSREQALCRVHVVLGYTYPHRITAEDMKAHYGSMCQRCGAPSSIVYSSSLCFACRPPGRQRAQDLAFPGRCAERPMRECSVGMR